VITGVILHLENTLPVVADLEALPEPTDVLVRCTNVRTVDGKRPSFVHDRNGTFIFPIAMIRLIEAPADGDAQPASAGDQPRVEAAPASAPAAEPQVALDEEPDEDLLARIRSI